MEEKNECPASHEIVIFLAAVPHWEMERARLEKTDAWDECRVIGQCTGGRNVVRVGASAF